MNCVPLLGSPWGLVGLLRAVLDRAKDGMPSSNQLGVPGGAGWRRLAAFRKLDTGLCGLDSTV